MACAPARVEPPTVAAPAVDTHELALEGGFITVRVDVPREPGGPRPAVISLLGEADRMLRMGIAVVTYRIHWERLRALAPKRPPATRRMWGKWLLASPTPGTVGRGFFRLIHSNASATIPKVLSALVDVPRIDMSRIGITGTSTNGFVSLQAAADPRISAAAVVAACGDYHRFLYHSSLAMHGQFLDLEPAYESWLHAREPVRHPERFVHAAVLMVNGTDDPATPLPCVRETQRVFQAAFARAGVPERFRSVVLPATGHVFPEEARHQVMAWWHRWLLHPSARDGSP